MEIWESLRTLAKAEEDVFRSEEKYTDSVEKIRRYADDSWNYLDDKVKVIVNNEVPVAVLELSETTDKNKSSIAYAGIGVGSECFVSGNLVLLQGQSPSKISWTIEEPVFSLSFPNIADVQKVIMKQAIAALRHQHKRKRRSSLGQKRSPSL